MERWIAYEKIQIKIEEIYPFSVGDGKCTIFFSEKKAKRKYALCFEHIVDFRYAVENAFLGRPASKIESDIIASIYVAEDSDYIKYFERQCGKIFPADGIRHFLLFDVIDTGIEILAYGDPVLTEIEE
jgi:hypothetical protein